MIDSYDKLTLGKWLELKDVDTEQEEIDVQVDILSILSDLTPDEIMALPLPEYSKLVNDSMFLSNEPPVIKKLPKTITIDGKEFDIVQKVETITAGQYIDYQAYLKDNNVPYILTCFIIPKGKKYGEGYSLEETSQLFKDYLPIGIAIGISRFFFALWETLTESMMDSSIKQVRKSVRKMKIPLKQKVKILAQLRSL